MNESTLEIKDELMVSEDFQNPVVNYDAGIMPLAISTGTTIVKDVCPCTGQTKSSFTLGFQRKTITYNPSNGNLVVFTTLGGGTTNAKWTLSGNTGTTGFTLDSRDNTNTTVNIAKNPNEDPRRSNHIVEFQWRGQTYKGTIGLTQQGRVIGDYESIPSGVTPSLRMTLLSGTTSTTYDSASVVTSGSTWSASTCNPVYLYSDVHINYKLNKTAQAYDTCGDKFDVKNSVCEGTSAETINSATTRVKLDPQNQNGSASTAVTYTLNYQDSGRTSSITSSITATVKCTPTYSVSISDANVTGGSCDLLAYGNPSVSVTKKHGTYTVTGATYNYRWTRTGSNFTSLSSSNVSNPYIRVESVNTGNTSRSDTWTCTVTDSNNGMTAGTVTAKFTQNGGTCNVTECDTSDAQVSMSSYIFDSGGETMALKTPFTASAGMCCRMSVSTRNDIVNVRPTVSSGNSEQFTISITSDANTGDTPIYDTIYVKYGTPISWEGPWIAVPEDATDSKEKKRYVSNRIGTTATTIMTCWFSGLSSITFKYGASSESGYDYVGCSALDGNITSASTGVETSKGSTGTKEYKITNIPNPEQRHFVKFAYSKDTSNDYLADRGWVYVSDYTLEEITNPSATKTIDITIMPMRKSEP